MVGRNLNLYLDTLYSAFEMIGSGTTTVQHIHGWARGPYDTVKQMSQDVLRAYDDIGMRVSYCYAVRDQNRLVYQADADLVASLPEELRGPMQTYFETFQVGLEDSLTLFRELHEEHNAKRRTKIQLAPANLHWCSDAALAALSETSAAYTVPLHMHLLETSCQKEVRLAPGRVHGVGVRRPVRVAFTAADAGPRCLALRERYGPPGRGGGVRVPQLLVQFSAPLRHRRAQRARSAGDQHRHRARRGGAE